MAQSSNSTQNLSQLEEAMLKAALSQTGSPEKRAAEVVRNNMDVIRDLAPSVLMKQIAIARALLNEYHVALGQETNASAEREAAALNTQIVKLSHEINVDSQLLAAQANKTLREVSVTPIAPTEEGILNFLRSFMPAMRPNDQKLTKPDATLLAKQQQLEKLKQQLNNIGNPTIKRLQDDIAKQEASIEVFTYILSFVQTENSETSAAE